MTSHSPAGKLAMRYTMVLGLLAVLIGGCSEAEPMGTVQGKVLLDDKPYSNAEVVFLSLSTGQGGNAAIQSDGSFSLAEPLKVGEYTVYLAPKAQPNAEAPVPVTIDTSVPDKYWNEASSDVKVQVNEGANDVTVALKH